MNEFLATRIGGTGLSLLCYHKNGIERSFLVRQDQAEKLEKGRPVSPSIFGVNWNEGLSNLCDWKLVEW